jgi:DNA helicase-2/ATP-dependent DNA helicase PcrA
LKNNLISPSDYFNDALLSGDDASSGRPKMGEIYAAYDRRLFKSAAMDFDDLLFKTNVLLRDFPEVLYRYQHMFQYILVDEYQDTNFAQYLIVKQLGAVFQNVCVVGDDAQSIYAFRGANIQNILNFRKDYPDFKLYKLEQNYRSTEIIVEAANSIIAHNKDRINKTVWTANPKGEKIHVHRCLTDNDEGMYVANQIFQTLRSDGASPAEFAILYRTNAQSRALEESLRKLNIPYRIYGGMSFYQRKEVKDLLAYFRFVCNPSDEEAFKRVVNYPKRGIGDASVSRMVVYAAESGISLWEVLCNPQMCGLNSSASQRILDFTTLIKSFRIHLDTMNAADLAEKIALESTLMKELYADRTPEGVSRYENIQELLNGIKSFTEQNAEEEKSHQLSDFLLEVALLTDANTEEDNEEGKVSLMTVHAAKGLEFKYVNLVGMEDGLFPSQMSMTREEIEEERRLFYVAVTRAMSRLTMSHAESRFKWGNLQFSEPSVFLDEIDAKFLDRSEAPVKRKPAFDFRSAKESWGSVNTPASFQSAKKNVEITSTPVAPPKGFRKLSPANASPSLPAEYASVQVGTEVKHEKFGKGKVIALEGELPETKATIFFPTSGQKQLLLKFAKLQIL